MKTQPPFQQWRHSLILFIYSPFPFSLFAFVFIHSNLSLSLIYRIHSIVFGYLYQFLHIISLPLLTMSFFEDLFILPSFKTEVQSLSDLLFPGIAESMVATCDSAEGDSCRDDWAARTLKFAAIASILVAGMIGVAIPLAGKHRRFLRTDSNLFVAAKAFAAGVILATGFVHMLAGGSEALSNSCLPKRPWKKFPFAGFFAMMAALLTLLVDFVGTQYYERKKGLTRKNQEPVGVGLDEPGQDTGIVPVLEIGKVQEDGRVHIVAMHAHVAHHSNCHGSGSGHEDGYGSGDEESGSRNVVVSQILELGIVSHSVIIGLSLGVSESPCTIRPLIAALSFHQFFEGFALGGCISQAQFNNLSATLMACFFAITTPAGIGIGMAISWFYNPYSQGALIAEGILDSLSAGILVYMALVDLIAADFLSKKMRCNFRLQLVSYFMLFVGAGMMSALAIWA